MYIQLSNNRSLVLICFLLLLAPLAYSQNKQAILGSGKVVEVPVGEIKPFSELEFSGIPGDKNSIIEVQVGEIIPACSISADDNLAQLFSIKQNGNVLSIALTGNRDNKMWIEAAHIRIKISMPTLSRLQLASNGSCYVRGIQSSNLLIEKKQNGDLYLAGAAKRISMRKSGNGDVFADSLSVDNAWISSEGNGSVHVHANKDLRTERFGNGNIVNTGEGKITEEISSGNGRTIGKEEAEKIEKRTPSPSIKVTLLNKTNKKDFVVRGDNGNNGGNFSYGIEIGPGKTRTESFPIGTKIQTKLGVTLYEVRAEDAGKTISLQ